MATKRKYPQRTGHHMGMIREIWQEAHSAIDSGYSDAINHYTRGKASLLKQLSQVKEVTEQQLIDQIQDAIATELKSEDWNTEFNQYFTQIREAFAQYIDTGSPAFTKLSKIAQDKLTSGKQDRAHYYQRLKDELNKYLSSEQLNRSTLSILAQLGNIGDKSVEQYFGYLRQIVLQKASAEAFQANTANYINALKGQEKEVLVAKAMQQVMSDYGARAEQTGADTDDNNKQIIYDVILFSKNQRVQRSQDQPFKHIIKRLEKIAGSQEVTAVDQWAYGVQSKSWEMSQVPADAPAGIIYQMHFGSYAAGMPTGEEKYYWHAGVRNAMNKIKEILGAGNVIYTLGGNQVYWTSDLLAEMRRMNLVLGYYKRTSGDKKNQIIASPGVSAFVHKD